MCSVNDSRKLVLQRNSFLWTEQISTNEIYSLSTQEYSEDVMRVQHDTIRCEDLDNGVTDIHDDHPGRSRI